MEDLKIRKLTLKDDEKKINITIQGASEAIVKAIATKAKDLINWSANPAQMQFNLTTNDQFVLGRPMLRMDKPRANSKKASIGITCESASPETLAALYNLMQAGKNPIEILLRYEDVKSGDKEDETPSEE